MPEGIRIKKGVRQGCILSVYLFSIATAMEMRGTLRGFKGVTEIACKRQLNLNTMDASQKLLIRCGRSDKLLSNKQDGSDIGQ
jgi:hypothetical protein